MMMMMMMLMIIIFSQQKWLAAARSLVKQQNNIVSYFWGDSAFLSAIGFFRAGAAVSIETSRRKLKCENVHLQAETPWWCTPARVYVKD